VVDIQQMVDSFRLFENILRLLIAEHHGGVYKWHLVMLVLD